MKVVQWPALPECGGGVLVGGDTGEFSSATAGGLSTREMCFPVERCRWCGW
jgi:hypothetical protein